MWHPIPTESRVELQDHNVSDFSHRKYEFLCICVYVCERGKYFFHSAISGGYGNSSDAFLEREREERAIFLSFLFWLKYNICV